MTLRKIIGLALVVVMLGIGIRYMLIIDREEQARVSSLYTMVEPLQKERETLVAERNSMQLDYALMMRDVSTVQLIFRQLDDNLFSEVYPLMRDHGITGVIGLSRTQLPGYFRMISVEQYNRLLMDGWGSCAIYDGTENFELWLSRFRINLENQKLEMPTAIYFPGNQYKSEFDEKLIENGFTTVIIDSDNGRSPVSDVQGQLWITGARPWNYTGVTADTEQLARTDGGNLSFTISFSNLWDVYESESFEEMLKIWESYLVSEDTLVDQTGTVAGGSTDILEAPLLRVLNYDAARRAHQDALENNTVLEEEFKQRLAELDQKIAELDEQISQIYKRWKQ